MIRSDNAWDRWMDNLGWVLVIGEFVITLLMVPVAALCLTVYIAGLVGWCIILAESEDPSPPSNDGNVGNVENVEKSQ